MKHKLYLHNKSEVFIIINENVVYENKINIEELVKKAKEGDSAATKNIIDRYKYFIIKEAAKYHVPGYEFEDLVQHGYLSVVKAVNMYKLGSNSFDGYLINTIKTNFKALLKGQIKHFREIPDNTLLDIKNNYEFTLEDQVIAYEEVEKLYKALDKLQPQEREIIERFYIFEDSLKEIACDWDVKYYTAVKMKENALKKLRELI